MKSQTVTRSEREHIAIRDGHRCARCGQSILNIPSSVHHRKPRGMGGTRDPRSSDPRNLILLCGTGTTGCHGWIETNRAEARILGWLVSDYLDLGESMLCPDGRSVTLGLEWGRRDSYTWAGIDERDPDDFALRHDRDDAILDDHRDDYAPEAGDQE